MNYKYAVYQLILLFIVLGEWVLPSVAAPSLDQQIVSLNQYNTAHGAATQAKPYMIQINTADSYIQRELSMNELVTKSINHSQGPDIYLHGFIRRIDPKHTLQIKLPSPFILAKRDGSSIRIRINLKASIQDGVDKQEIDALHYTELKFPSGEQLEWIVEGYIDPLSLGRPIPPGSYSFLEGFDFDILVDQQVQTSSQGTIPNRSVQGDDSEG